MKAILTNYYVQPHEHVIHEDVVEVGTIGSRRILKCKKCGYEWTEHLNSPMVLDEDVANNLQDYYGSDKIIWCSQLK